MSDADSRLSGGLPLPFEEADNGKAPTVDINNLICADGDDEAPTVDTNNLIFAEFEEAGDEAPTVDTNYLICAEVDDEAPTVDTNYLIFAEFEEAGDEDAEHTVDNNSLIFTDFQPHEKVLTAEEVIREIDDIMNETADEYNFPQNVLNNETADEGPTSSSPRYTAYELKGMSIAALQELERTFTSTTETLSRVLVSELDVRDQLQFDKELKNQFISLLHTVQKKRREIRRKSKVPRFGWSQIMKKKVHFPTIPYNPLQDQSTSEQLQVYISILQAMNEDSSSVPQVLVNYILRVLCPT